MTVKMLVYKRRDENNDWWVHLNPTMSQAHHSRQRWEGTGAATHIKEVELDIDGNWPRIMGVQQFNRQFPGVAA